MIAHLFAAIRADVSYAGRSPENRLTVMTEGPLQLRILRYTLLGPIDDARHILRRLQNNEAFQHYLRRRTLRALPLVVGILLTSLACSAAVVFLFFRAGILLVLAATIVVAPIVLIASFSVQAYVLLSWLEGRSLAKLQEHHRPRHRGPIGQWLVRSYRIDMGPLPQVPWIPALVFFLVPAAMLAQVAAPLGAGRGRGTQVFRGSSSAGGAGSQAGRRPGLRLPRGPIGHRKLDPAPSFFR